MTYICFIECASSSVPYMEPLQDDDTETAMRTTRRLMSEHPTAIAAHLFLNEKRIATLTVGRAGNRPEF